MVRDLDKPVTLAALQNTTPQKVFDRVVSHLRKQGKQAWDDDAGECRYRTGTPVLRCAVGCLLTTEEYDTRWLFYEGETVEALATSRSVNFGRYRKLLGELQFIHDMCNTKEWESEFRRLAKRWKLKYEALTKKKVGKRHGKKKT